MRKPPPISPSPAIKNKERDLIISMDTLIIILIAAPHHIFKYINPLLNPAGIVGKAGGDVCIS